MQQDLERARELHAQAVARLNDMKERGVSKLTLATAQSIVNTYEILIRNYELMLESKK